MRNRNRETKRLQQSLPPASTSALATVYRKRKIEVTRLNLFPHSQRGRKRDRRVTFQSTQARARKENSIGKNFSKALQHLKDTKKKAPMVKMSSKRADVTRLLLFGVS